MAYYLNALVEVRIPLKAKYEYSANKEYEEMIDNGTIDAAVSKAIEQGNFTVDTTFIEKGTSHE